MPRRSARSDQIVLDLTNNDPIRDIDAHYLYATRITPASGDPFNAFYF